MNVLNLLKQPLNPGRWRKTLCCAGSLLIPLVLALASGQLAPAKAQTPQRIVSLLPSLTGTVCVLGGCDKLVGVDRYSKWPERYVAQLPVVGGGMDPNIEAIVALKPDVVLMANSARTVQRLQALGLKTVALETQTQADMQHVLHVVGALLEQPPERAALEWQRLQTGIDAAAQTIPANVRGTRVYFEVSRGPYAAGPTSFIGELLARMGVDNIVPQDMGPFPRLNPEFILRARPDVILISNQEQSTNTYPGWQTLTAVQQQRVCTFSEQQRDIVVQPGPRMDEAARLIAACLREKAPRRDS